VAPLAPPEQAVEVQLNPGSDVGASLVRGERGYVDASEGHAPLDLSLVRIAGRVAVALALTGSTGLAPSSYLSIWRGSIRGSLP